MLEILGWAILGVVCFLAGPIGWFFWWLVFALSLLFKLVRFVLRIGGVR